MRNHKTLSSTCAWLVCLLSAAACSSSETAPQSDALSSALENPIIACQSQFNACPRKSPGDVAKCDASMRMCLQGVAAWLQQSRQLLGQCAADADKCRLANPTSPTCRTQFNACIAPLFTNDEDAGVNEEDAGSSTKPTGAAGKGAAGHAAPSGGAAGHGAGPGLPMFPPPFGPPNGQGLPGLPGLPTGGASAAAGGGAPGPTPQTCMSDMLTCMVPGANLAECAMHARECLRQSVGPRP